ncbi:MAG: Uma2 family endonuclease [Agathobacter sp.]|nr:Uma2 family endonuclease [Agathobacter sp.]MEE1101278.1 Uma2 family endonuclease [Agathobacter sp.]
MQLQNENTYTTDYIYSLPEGQRAELINGTIYNMAPPNRLHQDIVMNLSAEIRDYIKKNNGSCKVYPAPFAVFLNNDNQTYVEPDISVICDKSKLDDRGCNGAPDWIIEVVSQSTKRMDYGIKLFKYRTAGVREYWIVNPLNKTVNVYDLLTNELTDQYDFNDNIPVCIYKDLTINFANLLK